MKKECKCIGLLLTATIIVSTLSGCVGEKEESPAPVTTAVPITAISPTATPFPFEEIETVQLIVKQSYLQIEEEFSLPFAEGCKQVLESGGFTVVDATQYDATLLVEITGEALGANYTGSGYLHRCSHRWQFLSFSAKC